MEHFIIIRFSVKFNNSPEFQTKVSKLFDENRLNFRFELFENYCLKSIKNQSLKNFKVIILYDENLPIKYFNKLIYLTQNENYIYLHKWDITKKLSSNEWLKMYLINKDSNNYIITTRLDDDDMINYDLNHSLKRYIKKFNCYDKIISFKGGYFLNFVSDKKLILVPIKYSSLGIFLSKIHKINDNNIYGHVHHNHGLSQRIINKSNAFIVINHIYENDNRLDRFIKKQGKEIVLNDIEILMSNKKK